MLNVMSIKKVSGYNKNYLVKNMTICKSKLTKIWWSSFGANASWFWRCWRRGPWSGWYSRDRIFLICPSCYVLTASMITILTTWLISSLLIPSIYHASFSENGCRTHRVFTFASNKIPKTIIWKWLISIGFKLLLD